MAAPPLIVVKLHWNESVCGTEAFAKLFKAIETSWYSGYVLDVSNINNEKLFGIKVLNKYLFGIIFWVSRLDNISQRKSTGIVGL